MPEGDADHPAHPSRRRDGRLLRRLTAGLVVLVLVAAGLVHAFDLGGRWFGLGVPSPVTQPALVLPHVPCTGSPCADQQRAMGTSDLPDSVYPICPLYRSNCG